MRFDLRYGAGSLPLEIPERIACEVMKPLTIENNSEIERTFVNAIEKPIGSDSLSHIVSGANSIAVVVNRDPDIEPIPLILNKFLDFLQVSISPPSELLVIYPIDSTRSESSDTIADIFDSPKLLYFISPYFWVI